MNKEEFIEIFREAYGSKEYDITIKEEMDIKILQSKSIFRKTSVDMGANLTEKELQHVVHYMTKLHLKKAMEYINNKLMN